jgi:hypothetical protein
MSDKEHELLACTGGGCGFNLNATFVPALALQGSTASSRAQRVPRCISRAKGCVPPSLVTVWQTDNKPVGTGARPK